MAVKQQLLNHTEQLKVILMYFVFQQKYYIVGFTYKLLRNITTKTFKRTCYLTDVQR